MSTANRILKIIYSNSDGFSGLSTNQIQKIITDKSQSNVRGRISELTKRGLVKRFNGKIQITDEGKKYIDNHGNNNNFQIKLTNHNRLSDRLSNKADFSEGFNYIITKKSKQNIKVWAKNEQNAQTLAKQIYGTGFKIKNIE